jgi:DNA mismatch repair protein MutS2
MREKEREADRQARQGARKYLLEARTQVEGVIAQFKAQAAAVQEAAALDEAARQSRRAVEEAAAAQSAALQEAERREAERRARRAAERRLESGRAPAPAERTASPEGVTGRSAARPATRRPAPDVPLAPGDAVLVGTLDGKPGRVVACKGDEARVVVGSLTLTVPLATLTRTAAPPPPPVKVAVYGAVDAEGPLHEVDLRGLRVDELDDRLFSAVDAAVRADLREVRIIHGKGTGALRARVAELLRKDTRVTGSRLGAWNEGGAGVTVAELA